MEATVNKSKAKGTAWESAIVNWLNDNGHPFAERRALKGNQDCGDITGLPGVVIEAKAAVTQTWGPWLAELAVEMDNDRADVGVLWAKRRGKASAGDGLIVMTPAVFIALLTELGR
jgi:hypothetical protein